MRHSSTLLARMIQIGFLAALVGAWFIVTDTGVISSLFLPPLPKVWAEMQRLVFSGQLWSAAKVTLVTIGQAYAISATSGLIIGFLISRSPRAVRLFEPLLSGTFAIPLTLFFPLFIFFFGIGPASKVAYGALYSFFPIVLTAIAAFSRVDRHYVLSARSMGARGWILFRRVYLPYALPVVLTGMRIGFFICIASVLGGETISSAAGVGKAVAHSAELMETGRLYAWIVFVVLFSFMLNMVLSAVEAPSRERHA